jgi:hypothetical protein
MRFHHRSCDPAAPADINESGSNARVGSQTADITRRPVDLALSHYGLDSLYDRFNGATLPVHAMHGAWRFP